jgi:Na+/H+ antiporter NhaD/arsenite permease-like protein
LAHRACSALPQITMRLIRTKSTIHGPEPRLVGASANVVVLGIAERAGHRISFWQFTKYGLLVATVTIAISMPYLWLRYFVLNG